MLLVVFMVGRQGVGGSLESLCCLPGKECAILLVCDEKRTATSAGHGLQCSQADRVNEVRDGGGGENLFEEGG